MKTCSKCKLPKDICEFSLLHPAKKDGKLRPDCKQCVRQRQKDIRARDPDKYDARLKAANNKARLEARAFIAEYLQSHPCVDCGETDLDVLDFDHVRGTKVCGISEMVNAGYRLWRIKEEIEKCEVRCANDHRRVTAKRRRLYEVNRAEVPK